MSRLKSARGAASSSRPAARAARPSGAGRGVYVQAARPGIYEALLGVALGAILLGCILMLLVLNRYEFKTKAAGLSPSAGVAPIAALAPVEIFSTVRL